jgi:uncharacterized protein (TIGR02246 family)
MTPEEAAAVAAIRHTQSVYNTEGDRGRADGLLDTFTEDGVLEFHGRAHQGREAIRAALSPAVDANRERHAPGFVRHNLTTCRVELDGPDAANAWTYFMVVTPIGLDHTGRYVDRFRREGGRWLLAHRRVTIDWAAAESAQQGRS